jgi:hypothetical protein
VLAAWQLCSVAPVNAYDAQRLLAADGAGERLALLVELMDDLELDLRRMLTGAPGAPGEPGEPEEPG